MTIRIKRQRHYPQNSDYDLAIAFSSCLKDPIERRLRPELQALKWKKS